jgi:hypothetical protein
MSNKPKGPRVIVDFTDELSRQLSSEVLAASIDRFIEQNGTVDVKGIATLFSVSESVARTYAKQIPVIDLGERTHRYKIADVIAFREKNTIKPK